MGGYACAPPTKLCQLICYLSLVDITMQKNSEPKFSQMKCLHSKTEGFNVLHSRILLAKSKKQCFLKLKELHFQPILGPLCQFKDKKEFFWNMCLFYFILFLNLYCCAKLQKKTNGQIPKKVGYRLTGIKMNNQQTSINSQDLLTFSLSNS